MDMFAEIDDAHSIENQQTSLDKPLLKEICEEDQSLQIERTFVQDNRLKEGVCSPKLRLIWGKPLTMVSGSEELRIMCGVTPEEWAKRTRDPRAREVIEKQGTLIKEVLACRKEKYGDVDPDDIPEFKAAKLPEEWYIETPEMVAEEEARRAAARSRRIPHFDPFNGLYGVYTTDEDLERIKSQYGLAEVTIRTDGEETA